MTSLALLEGKLESNMMHSDDKPSARPGAEPSDVALTFALQSSPKSSIGPLPGVCGTSTGSTSNFTARPATSVSQFLSGSARMIAARASPRWVADATATRCMLCELNYFRSLVCGASSNSSGEAAVLDRSPPVPFGGTNRRHHCRYCGWVVCATCIGML